MDTRTDAEAMPNLHKACQLMRGVIDALDAYPAFDQPDHERAVKNMTLVQVSLKFVLHEYDLPGKIEVDLPYDGEPEYIYECEDGKRYSEDYIKACDQQYPKIIKALRKSLAPFDGDTLYYKQIDRINIAIELLEIAMFNSL